ncbi:MAG: AMP-binding protein [Lachnospiraceae bacterium]|nr:AMP-binding protein [Lachnospiraceae bacterium]
MLIRDILEESEKKYAEIKAVKWLKKKGIYERSYRELMKNVVKVRKGLLAEGFQGKHIALIGTSSVEWIESYLGIITGKNVAVPLDAGLPGEDLIDLINRSDSEALFLSPKNKALLEEVSVGCPKLKKIWMLQEEEPEGSDEKTVSLASLMAVSKNSDADADRPDPEDMATIIFTSGTTGKSKGVMLTQNNLATNVIAVNYTREPGTVMLSVLPIHHAFCLVMDWLKGFSLGATVCINDSLLHMVKNMGLFKPDVMLMVPLMLETIYKRLSAASPLIPKKMVAAKAFGGNLKIIFTGGAHLDPYYIDKFADYGIEVLEGYGMSECSPVISSNLPEDHKAGSIGRPLSNVEIAFEDGEILVKGSSVMKGYYKMPEETAETLRDGWLHTGDKGYLDEDGFLFINGRVKNLIILSNGENISPEEIENKLALGKLVGEVIVTGEDNGLTARIYPDQDVVAAKRMSEEKIHTELQAFLDQYNKNQPSYRQITGLVVRKNPFIRNSTKKIKRQDALIDEALPTT